MKLKWNRMLVLPLLIAIGGLWILWPHSNPKAGWFDDNFLYRKKITVTNNTSTENNVYVTLSGFDTSDQTRFQGDCGDVRFIKYNGEKLPYFVVSGCSTSSTSFHIKFDTLTAGAQDIYIYYGNKGIINGGEGADFSTAATNATVGSPAAEENSVGPLAFWKFDEGAENTCVGGRNDLCDHTQSNYDMTSNGPTRKSEDMCFDGKCLFFDGTNDYTMINDKDTFDFAASDSFTLSGWFKHAPKSSGTDVLLNKQQTTLGTGSTASTTITTSTDEGIGGYDAAWGNRVVYDPNNNRWHVIYIDSGNDIHSQSTSATSGTAWTDGVDLKGAASGDYNYEDFSCVADTDGATTYLHCTYSIQTAQNLYYVRCQLTGAAPYISCGSEQTVYSSGTAADDIQYPRIAVDSLGCSLIISDFQDSTTDAGDQHEIWLWKEAQPCGDGTWTTETGFPKQSIQSEAGYTNTNDLGVGIKSYAGTRDAQLFWVNTDDATTVALNTMTFYGDTNTLGTQRTLNSDVEYRVNNEHYSSVAFNAANVSFAALDGSTDLKSYKVSGLNAVLDGTADTILNIPANTAQLDGYTSAAVDTVASGGDDVYVFGMNNSDNTDIYYNQSTNGGTSWNGSSTLWVNSFDANETKYLSSEFNRKNCDIMLGWIGNFGTVNIDTKILNTGSCNTPTNTGYKLQMESDGDLTFYVSDGTNSDVATSTAATYDDNNWHHFDAVKNGTSNIKLYIDGQLVASDNSIAATGSLANSNDFYLGIDSDRTSNDYNGFLDNVKIYKYARSDSQILSDSLKPAQPAPKGNSVGIGKGSSDFLNNGLVGYWKFDESAAGGCAGGTNDSCDSSGNLNDGDWTNGATYTTTARFGNAVTFDGTNDSINFVDNDSLTPSDITISSWIKMTALPSSTGQDQFIMRKSHGVSPFNAYHWYVKQTDNKLRFEWYDSTGANNFLNSNTALTAGTWYHVAVSKSGNFAKIFINGVEDASSSTFTVAMYNSTGPLRIGSNGSSANFYGQIDEARIYNRGLSPSEVAALYNWAPGPVGNWKLDENSGTTTYDSSTNALNGMITSSSWITGVKGSALNFGTGKYVTVSDNSLIKPTSAITVETWFRSTDLTASQRIISKKNTTGYRLALSTSTCTSSSALCFLLRIGGVDQSVVYSRTNLSNNTWYHVAGTYDGTNMNLYVNGVLVSTLPMTGAIQQGTQPLCFGAEAASSDCTGGSELLGDLDDIRIYDYARTPAQIIEDMNGGHPMGGSPVGSQAGYWKFDEGALNTCSGGTNDFCDSSINVNDLAFSGTAGGITLSGKFNKAFDGNAARWASRADDDDFDFAAADDFTLSAWIKTDGTASGIQYILNKSSASSQGYGIYGSSSGKVVFAIDDDTSWTPDDQAQSTTNVFDQAWHYIAARKTGTSKIDIFVDGRLEGSDTSLGATGSLSNAVSLYIGDRDGTDNGDELNGDIDEVKIYRGALTNDQIKLDYNRGSAAVIGSSSTASDGITADNSASREYCVPGDTSTCNPPIGEWKMDENTGTTSTADTSGNNNNASFNGSIAASQWTPGKKGSALSFDGANDYVQADNATLYDMGTTTPFTISGWFKSNASGTTQNVFFAINNTSNYYRIQVNGGFLRAQIVDTGGSTFCTLRTASTIDDGKWHYFAALFNRNASCTTSDIVIYIDGQKETTTVVSSGLNTNVNLDETGIRIGGNSSFFTGPIDNIRLYDYIRNPAQIAWEYNQGGPVAHYKFDECSGTTAYNSVLNGNGQAAGNNGTLTIGATGSNTSVGTCTGASTEAWKNGANGKINASLSFDGTNDYVSLGNNAFGDMTDNHSISMWIKTSAANGTMLSEYQGGSCGDGYIDIYTNKLDFDDGSGATYITGTTTVTNGQWHHVVFVSDTSNAYLYVDGKLDATSGDVNWGNGCTAQDVRIGSRTNANYFSGQIDDLRVYKYSLTPYQVRLLYSQNAAALFTPITGSP